MPVPALDGWLPDPQVTSRHRLASTAAKGTLWEAAQGVRLDETRTLGRLIRWRIPGTDGGLTFAELFARYPFAVLDEGPGWSLSGLCGAIWTPARDYPEIDGEAFRGWRKAGTVRVLFGHWVEDDPAGSALVSEARVAPVDRFARLQLRALWLLVRRFERVIGAEPLPLAVDRAEALTRAPRPAGR